MIPLTTIDRAMAKLHRELGEDSINEVDFIEWTGEALQAMESPSIQEEAVAFCEVRNHRALVPQFTSAIIQIARNNKWSKQWNIRTACRMGDSYFTGDPTTTVADNVLCPAVIEQEAQASDPGCSQVLEDCFGNIITPFEPVYYRPYFDLRWQYSGWTGTRYYRTNYTPVRLKTHNFFNTLVCQEEGWEDIYQSCSDEYSIDWPYLTFSFKEGSIAIAYLRPATDERGLPMIPDRIEYLQAITYYVRWKLAERKADRNPSFMQVADRARSLWLKYASQAADYTKMPSPDEMQNLVEQGSYLMPRRQQYYGFFGQLNKQEIRTYLNS